MTHTLDSNEPEQRLLELLAGKWIVSALSTAASLGIADCFAEASRSAASLARELACDEASLARLLRVLAGEGVLEQDSEDRYSLTAMGACLKREALGPLVAFVGSRSQWEPWARLEHSVRTGEPAFTRSHGMGLFDYLAAHPEESRRYDEAVDVFTRGEAQILSQRFDFTRVEKVVDVGGGRGTLLLELLGRWPHLTGVLFDLESVARAARQRLEEKLGSRCAVAWGDFRTEAPAGADVYVIKRVLHNWDDADALRILEACARAMALGGQVWVVEGVLLAGNRRDGTRLLDLEMMVLTGGGRERTKPEFRRLFHAAGLRLVETAPLRAGIRLLVGVARETVGT